MAPVKALAEGCHSICKSVCKVANERRQCRTLLSCICRCRIRRTRCLGGPRHTHPLYGHKCPLTHTHVGKGTALIISVLAEVLVINAPMSILLQRSPMQGPTCSGK